jgi:uncharacterized protein YdhG (YjbR/CyaY superfamily)
VAGARTVDEYLARVPEPARTALQDLREAIKAAAPEAIETISYNMPTFKVRGQFLVSYASYRNHCSLYPATKGMMEAHGEELKPFFSEKATLRFTPESPIPEPLVEKLIRIRLREAEEERAAR